MTRPEPIKKAQGRVVGNLGCPRYLYICMHVTRFDSENIRISVLIISNGERLFTLSRALHVYL